MGSPKVTRSSCRRLRQASCFSPVHSCATGFAPTWLAWTSSESCSPSAGPRPLPKTLREGESSQEVTVFDASALLSYLQGEDGSITVEAALEAGRACGAANCSEAAQKVRAHGRDWALARSLLLSYGLVIEPVTVDDAERAAETWRPGQDLSLATGAAWHSETACPRWSSLPDRAWAPRTTYNRSADRSSRSTSTSESLRLK
ncbi:MAG: PIN domain-containing protein [Acidimicrobiales bacterium]